MLRVHEEQKAQWRKTEGGIMAKRIFGNWYNLPEGLRKRLQEISTAFVDLRGTGGWAAGGAGRYEPEAIAVLRVHHLLSWDCTMPRLKKLMEAGVRVAVFSPGMKVMDIVFISKEE